MFFSFHQYLIDLCYRKLCMFICEFKSVEILIKSNLMRTIREKYYMQSWYGFFQMTSFFISYPRKKRNTVLKHEEMPGSQRMHVVQAAVL